ncbi:MAG: hypothetical protein ABI315_06025 [Bacteroidia bacterium]
MKTKITLIALLAILISSCSAPKYLPSSDKIDVNQNGSYIKVNFYRAANIPRSLQTYYGGELIAIDSNKMVILSASTHKCATIQIKDVKRFNLRYAKPKHYGWTIPLYTLATIAHGFLLIYTAPINLIVTTAVTISGENAFQYNKRNMTYEKLKMFARFPQGIPPNIDLANIK